MGTIWQHIHLKSFFFTFFFFSTLSYLNLFFGLVGGDRSHIFSTLCYLFFCAWGRTQRHWRSPHLWCSTCNRVGDLRSTSHGGWCSCRGRSPLTRMEFRSFLLPLFSYPFSFHFTALVVLQGQLTAFPQLSVQAFLRLLHLSLALCKLSSRSPSSSLVQRHLSQWSRFWAHNLFQ